VAYALARQRPELNIVKRERWTEDDLDVLPAEEPDIFERKRGELFDFADQGKFLDDGSQSFLSGWGKKLQFHPRSLIAELELRKKRTIVRRSVYPPLRKKAAGVVSNGTSFVVAKNPI
jgi:hypothetical protein